MANAVLDGCDAILLGAETLRGKQPVATVETILHICKQAERCFDHRHHFEHLMSVSPKLGRLVSGLFIRSTAKLQDSIQQEGCIPIYCQPLWGDFSKAFHVSKGGLGAGSNRSGSENVSLRCHVWEVDQ